MASQLDEAMLNHMRYLAFTEGRSFSYLDFQSFEFNGKTYGMKHGTYRNKIREFKRIGIVETEYNSGTAFHTLKDVLFGKRKKKRMMTPSMTPNHMGVLPVTGVTNTEDIFKLPIYKEIQKLTPAQKALHDIHLKFKIPDIWSILSSSKKYNQNSISKDIALPPVITNSLKIRTIVHRTDTVTITVACSFAPIATDTDGLIRLSNALTRAEERTSRILDECGKILPGGYESIPIPDHCKWIVTLWHIGVDSYNYREYSAKKYCATWSIAEKVIARTYSKNQKNKGLRNRHEVQQCPNKPFAEAMKDHPQVEGV